MKRKMLINAAQHEETRVAITENGQLFDLDIDLRSRSQKKANIYKGKISRIEPSLNVVFVDYGAERHGFLPIREIAREYFADPRTSIHSDDIYRQLKVGQELLVQVEKEERGNKGAAITTYISLAGCYLVLMPNNAKAGGISRRIEGEDRQAMREMLKNLKFPSQMGAIIRTACLGRSLEELQWDVNTLLKSWEAIQEAYHSKPGPFLVYQESDVILRSVRDYLRQDIEEIIVDTKAAYDAVRHHVQHLRPDFIDRVKLDASHQPIFNRYRIEKQIETAYTREITLPSGGSIVIDHTEALTSIDINSARATKGGDIEETAFATNCEAAKEIARQLKIRDLGGLIVIDFIDMTSPRNQKQVETVLQETTQTDRARIQIGKISQFGLLEMSRQRLRPSLEEATTRACPRCHGQGTIRTTESLAINLIRQMRDLAHQGQPQEILAQTPVDVATYLLNEKRHEIDQIETTSGCQITIIPNRHIECPEYQINTQPLSQHLYQPSYIQVEQPQIELPQGRSEVITPESPAVQMTDMDSAPVIKKSKPGFFSHLWQSLFSQQTSANQEISAKKAQKPASSTQRSTRTQQASPRPKASDDLVEPVTTTETKRKGNQKRGKHTASTTSDRTSNTTSTKPPAKSSTGAPKPAQKSATSAAPVKKEKSAASNSRTEKVGKTETRKGSRAEKPANTPQADTNKQPANHEAPLVLPPAAKPKKMALKIDPKALIKVEEVIEPIKVDIATLLQNLQPTQATYQEIASQHRSMFSTQTENLKPEVEWLGKLANQESLVG